MGFKSSDINPSQVSAITPPGKCTLVKAFTVARTDVTPGKAAVILPASASIVDVKLFAGVASNAATTGTVTITVSDNSGTVSTGSANVKANATGTVDMSNLPNMEALPVNGDLKVTAVYAETGTASTAGGPWKFVITYAS